MLKRGLYVLTFAAAIGSGVVAGIFFAFSSFVMEALGRIASESGIAAMNAINITVYNPGFMFAFMGTAAVCLALAAGSYSLWKSLDGKLLLAASLIYIIACVGVTMLFNVPLNEALAAAAPGTQEEADLWTRFLSDWTFWNHVRTVAALVSAIMFIIGLIRRAGA